MEEMLRDIYVPDCEKVFKLICNPFVPWSHTSTVGTALLDTVDMHVAFDSGFYS
jgi:hypothetical protein